MQVCLRWNQFLLVSVKLKGYFLICSQLAKSLISSKIILFKELFVKTRYFPFLVIVLLIAACGQRSTPTPEVEEPTATVTFTPFPAVTSTQTPVPPTATVTFTPTVTLTPTPAYPLEGRGPANFAANVNPLTGLEVDDPTRLERRPIVIKVENIPREHRPQWGLTLADLVYEYYTEFGSTRFAAIYYGQDADMVGPIRSGRFFDSNVVQMYKGIFVYGSAYEDVRNRFYISDFASRLILETDKSCPAVCRHDPGGENFLMANTTALMDYVQTRSIDNTRQNQEGMFFQLQTPAGGEPAPAVYVRYSGAIYNRWDFDTASGRYLRFADAANDINRNNEVYKQLTDRLTNKPVAADNVVMMCVPHQYYVKREDAEVLDIIMDNRVGSYVACDGQTYTGGSGPAYVARDGQIYKVTWQRTRSDSVLTLINEDGSPFALKPGQTWFEVLGSTSRIEQQENAWRFTHMMQ